MSHVKTSFPLKTLAVVMFFVANYLFMTSQRLTDASKVSAIYQGMMIFAVLAGIFILNERENIARKIIGTIVVLGGVALLS